jgi:hypothetical protein
MVVFAKYLQRFHEEILGKAVVHVKEVKPNVVVSSKLRGGSCVGDCCPIIIVR